MDTLTLARRRHPGGPNRLDDLCVRYGIDNSRRTKHGALMDAELLSEVYAELVGGRQAKLGLGEKAATARRGPSVAAPRRTRRRVVNLTQAELAAHRVFAANLGPAAIWRDYLSDEDAGPAGEK